jgi:branched-chain amino acid aminotransferase
MSQSIHDFHDDPRNAGIKIWINGALKARVDALIHLPARMAFSSASR